MLQVDNLEIGAALTELQTQIQSLSENAVTKAVTIAKLRAELSAAESRWSDLDALSKRVAELQEGGTHETSR